MRITIIMLVNIVNTRSKKYLTYNVHNPNHYYPCIMSYLSRRSRGTRKRRSKKVSTLTAKTKTGAKAQANQIITLQKQLTSVKKKVGDNRQWAQYEINAGAHELVNGEWHIRELVDPPQWNARFQATDEIGENTKVNLHSLYLQLYYYPTDSLVPLTAKFITVYLVKLRKETALQTLEATAQMTDAGFNQTSNKNNLWNTQPIGLSYESLPVLNRGAFKVIKKRIFQVQNIIQNTAATSAGAELAPDVAVTTPKGTYKSVRMYLKCKNIIKSGRGDKSWKEMGTGDIEIGDRYYLITHVGGNGNEDTLEDGNTVTQGIHGTWTVKSTQ